MARRIISEIFSGSKRVWVVSDRFYVWAVISWGLFGTRCEFYILLRCAKDMIATFLRAKLCRNCIKTLPNWHSEAFWFGAPRRWYAITLEWIAFLPMFYTGSTLLALWLMPSNLVRRMPLSLNHFVCLADDILSPLCLASLELFRSLQDILCSFAAGVATTGWIRFWLASCSSSRLRDYKLGW